MNKPFTGRGLAPAALLALALAGPVQALPLVDAPSDPARAGRVQLALESFRILDAYPDKTFHGERPITRYELADALWRSLRYLNAKFKLPLDEDPRLGMIFQAYLKPSGDIPDRIWAAPALQHVLGYGLMSGTQDLKFHGGSKVSRYMLALTLNQTFDWLQVEPVRLASRSPRDLPAEHWARESVERLVAAGVFDIGADGRFDGERPATRYELAEALVKLLQQVDLVAQQRPLTPKPIIPVPTAQPTRPDGRKPPFYKGN